MHEVRATVPIGHTEAVARIAQKAGIKRVNISEILVHGAELRREHVVSVEVSTPQAKAFIDGLIASSFLTMDECSITSRELRAIVNREAVGDLTRPMVEPAPDVIQDLWQGSHVTWSYVGRAAGGALLMADGIIHNSAVSIVAAALFLPFLQQVLAAAFGLWTGDRGLFRKGVGAVLTSAVLAYAAGALVARFSGGPIRYQDFRGPLASFLISAVIGVAAGLSAADDSGRRYLIGVAAAVHFAIFPAWLGAASVIGLPRKSIVLERMGTFGINLFTIATAAVAAYAILGSRRKEFQLLRRQSAGSG
jgi:hypothetical protein